MATGGTGGHIYPAIATARELALRGYGILFVGQKDGMEQRITAEQQFEFIGVEAGKLARSGQGIADPRQLMRAAAGIKQARTILQRQKPKAVVGYGGFASLPGILSAQSLGIPTILHEQNAVLGLTQKLAVGRARAVGTAYKEVRGLDMKKAELVGMPVREDRLEQVEARLQLGLDIQKPTILIMGGSQGSLFLNETLPPLIRHVFGEQGLWRKNINLTTDLGLPLLDLSLDEGEPIQVIHATGPRWIESVVPVVADLPWYHPVGYLDAVAAWSAADLAITRAGTSTLAEAAVHGVPLLMVPLPESAENHQYYNALSVEQAGAGRVIEQARIHQLEEILPESLASFSMKEFAAQRAQLGAAVRFADLIERHISRN